MRIGIGIATVGRPSLLLAVIEELAAQLRAPDRIVVCAPTANDVDGLAAYPAVDLVIGPRGLTSQRNAILAELDDCDAVQFFDDDFLPATDYLSAVEGAFVSGPDVVVTTGNVIADGIKGPGLSLEEARRLLRHSVPIVHGRLEPAANGYGCNMAVRLAAVRAAQCRFDERLPLYGWLEDVDFGRQLVGQGRAVKVEAARGVHLGVKQGRQSGRRLGYSQVANPVYLSRKGTCPWRRSLRIMGRNIVANALGSLRPEPYIDRAGRLAGNLQAIADLAAGRLDPMRILDL